MAARRRVELANESAAGEYEALKNINERRASAKKDAPAITRVAMKRRLYEHMFKHTHSPETISIS